MNKLVFSAVVISVALCSQVAFSQDVKKDKRMDVFDFPDQPLVQTNVKGDDPSIVDRPGPVRTVLVRPRTQFITELLKSIEGL